MTIIELIGIFFAWNLFGFIIYAGIQANATMFTYYDAELLNPYDIYELWKVNYFGCTLLTIVFNLLCPIWSILYWFSRFLQFICTVGRR